MVAGSAAAATGSFLLSPSAIPMAHAFTQNEQLPTLAPAGWNGTPVDRQNRFVNHEYPFWPQLGQLLKWQWSANPQKQEKKEETWRLQPAAQSEWLHDGRDCIVWLGHNTFFFRLGDVTLLTDPVLGDVSFFLPRAVPFPVAPSHLTGIDYLLLSHDHRDHCDQPSLQRMAELNPQAQYLTGLNMAPLLGQLSKAPVRVQEAGWYQQYNTEQAGLSVYFLPSRHWSRRGLSDTNERLWGAYVIQGAGKTIYFSGDTGYGSHFKEAAGLFPKIDYCLMGVGAYKPEWFMHSSHMSPASAVLASDELKATHLIPMHYGTFDLSDEPLSDPYFSLLRMREEGAFRAQLHLPSPGEAIYL